MIRFVTTVVVIATAISLAGCAIGTLADGIMPATPSARSEVTPQAGGGGGGGM